MLRFCPRKTILLLEIFVSFGLMTSAGDAAEAPQKLRVAYAAVTAAFSIRGSRKKPEFSSAMVWTSS